MMMMIVPGWAHIHFVSKDRRTIELHSWFERSNGHFPLGKSRLDTCYLIRASLMTCPLHACPQNRNTAIDTFVWWSFWSKNGAQECYSNSASKLPDWTSMPSDWVLIFVSQPLWAKLRVHWTGEADSNWWRSIIYCGQWNKCLNMACLHMAFLLIKHPLLLLLDGGLDFLFECDLD